MPQLMPLYIMESVNLVVTDAPVTATSPGIQTYLQLTALKLPAVEEEYLDHTPGGASTAIEVQVRFNKLQSTFSLAGWNPEVMKIVGKDAQVFTANGLVREKRTSRAVRARAVMEGRLGVVTPDEFRKGDLFKHEYQIRGITHYELYFDGLIVYAWDFFTSDFYVGNPTGDVRNIHADIINRQTPNDNFVDLINP